MARHNITGDATDLLVVRPALERRRLWDVTLRQASRRLDAPLNLFLPALLDVEVVTLLLVRRGLPRHRRWSTKGGRDGAVEKGG